MPVVDGSNNNQDADGSAPPVVTIDSDDGEGYELHTFKPSHPYQPANLAYMHSCQAQLKFMEACQAISGTSFAGTNPPHIRQGFH